MTFVQWDGIIRNNNLHIFNKAVAFEILEVRLLLNCGYLSWCEVRNLRHLAYNKSGFPKVF